MTLDNLNLENLEEYALKTGATETFILSAEDIYIDKFLADKCKEPKCENFGLSKSCPPYTGGVEKFEAILKNFSKALFFRIEVPKEILFSSENVEIFRFLHETSAKIEKFAKDNGFSSAKAFAGGSCKKVFCYDFPDCLYLSSEKRCRFPEFARESMSGFGIDVKKLSEKAGWEMDFGKGEYSNIFGLVLL